jgi:hypothetical protein
MLRIRPGYRQRITPSCAKAQFRTLADLSRDLRTIPRVGITENSMVVNVEE